MSARRLTDKLDKSAGMESQPRRKRIGSTARRAQLVEVAEAVFIREGYERASMEQIADEAGVTRTLVYQHFPSKRDLYMAVLDRVIPEFIQRVIPPVEVRPKHPWRLLAGFRAFLTMLQEDQGVVNFLLGRGPREPWIAERLEQLYRFFSDYFAEEYKDVGSEPQVRLLAACYLGMMENIARVWPKGPAKEFDLESVAQTVAQFLWTGLSSFNLPATMVDEKYADVPPDQWRPNLEYLEALAERFPGLQPNEAAPKTDL